MEKNKVWDVAARECSRIDLNARKCANSNANYSHKPTDQLNLNNNSNICVGECDDVYGTAVNDREGIFLGGKFCTTSQHIACHVDSNSIGTLTTSSSRNILIFNPSFKQHTVRNVS